MRPGILKATVTYAGTQAFEAGDSASSGLTLNLFRDDPNSNLFFPGQSGAGTFGCGVSYHAYCDLSVTAALNYYDHHGGFGVQLGIPFSLQYTAQVASAGGGAYADTYRGFASLNESIQFSLFEADGVTPVAVLSDVSEPSTASLLVLPLLILMLACKWQYASNGHRVTPIASQSPEACSSPESR